MVTDSKFHSIEKNYRGGEVLVVLLDIIYLLLLLLWTRMITISFYILAVEERSLAIATYNNMEIFTCTLPK